VDHGTKNTLSAVFYLGSQWSTCVLTSSGERHFTFGHWVCLCWPAEQDGHGNTACGTTGDLLVATWTLVMEERRPALLPFFLLGRQPGFSQPGRTYADRAQGSEFAIPLWSGF